MAINPAKAITFSRTSSHGGIGTPLSGSIIRRAAVRSSRHRRGAKLIRMAPVCRPKSKTPPAPEDTDGVFHAFTSGKVAALDLKTLLTPVSFRPSRDFFPHGSRFADGIR